MCGKAYPVASEKACSKQHMTSLLLGYSLADIGRAMSDCSLPDINVCSRNYQQNLWGHVMLLQVGQDCKDLVFCLASL
eukprot:3449492-Amphidinium_carterae.3